MTSGTDEPDGETTFALENGGRRRRSSRAGNDLPRILIVAHDHRFLLGRVAAMLARDFTIVGTACRDDALAEVTRRLRPDILLVVIGASDLQGVEVGARVRRASPGTALVFVTMDGDPSIAAAAFAAGAAGYVVRNDTAPELPTALRAAVDGRSYLSKSVADGDISALVTPRCDQLATLSPRERDVLRRVALGMGMKEVARQLGISPRTVAFHKYRAMATLGLHGQAQLLAFALGHGLISRADATPPD